MEPWKLGIYLRQRSAVVVRICQIQLLPYLESARFRHNSTFTYVISIINITTPKRYI